MNTITQAPPIVTHAPATSYPPAADTAPAGRIYRRDLEKAYHLYSDAENRGVELAEAGRDELAAPWLKEGNRLWAELETLKARYKIQAEADELEIAARRAENEALWPEVQELIELAKLRDAYTASKSAWAQAKASPYGRITPATPNQFGNRQSPVDEAYSDYANARRELVQFIRQTYAAQAGEARMVSGTRLELLQRIDRAAEIAANRTAVQLGEGAATVRGSLKMDGDGNDITPVYTVTIQDGRAVCNCPDFAHRAPETSRAKVCKHILAVRMTQELEEVEE